MTNGSKPSNVTISAITMPYFSSSIAKAGIAPLSRVVIGSLNVPVCCEVEMSIIGIADSKEFLYRADFSRECFHSDSYLLKKSDSCVFDFDASCFTYDNAFLSGLDKPVTGEIYVRIKLCDDEYVAKTFVTLLPSNTWLGLEGEPSVVCSFVTPDDSNISSICKDLPKEEWADYTQSSKKNLVSTVKKLYKLIKECNIIYTRPSGYTASSKQTVRTAKELFGSGSILATPLEISLIFSSAAERCGFDTSLLFVRSSEGEINVLCGVYLVKSTIDIPVCENAEKIRALVDAGDMLIVDPSVFAAAQNTSFAFVCETTAENFVNNPQSLVCMIDVKSARRAMNIPCDEDEAYLNLPVKNGIAKLYSSLVSSPVMQYLSGKKRSEFEEIPLLYPDFTAALYDEGDNLLVPLDVNVHLEDFAAIDKDFSSILTMFSPMARQHFSSGEKLRMRERFDKLKSRISKPGVVTCALKDDKLYDTAMKMTFGKNKREPYFSFGYVKITDKLTELVSFAPICLVKASLTYENGSFYVKQTGRPIVNKVFIRNALKDSALGYDSFMKALMPEDKKEIFDMFENIRQALEDTDDRHVYEIIREAHLVNIELDDYILWSNLSLERNKLAMSSAARCVFGDGEKQSPRYNREYIPCTELFIEGAKAVCTDNDVIVTGAFSGEKEEILYASCARSITEGKSMLVVTDDAEQSEYVKKVLERNGLYDCVMCTKSDTTSAELYEKMKESLDKYGFMDGNVSIGFAPVDLSEAERELKGYTERINKLHPLGMTLRGAVTAYLYSCKGLEDVPEIYVDEHLFENADSRKLEEIFDEVDETVSLARHLCEKSGLKKYTPIERHPLYHTNPARVPTDAEMQVFCQEVQRLQPVLSSYRDVFSDVNEILGIDEREINSLSKLDLLSKLYELVLSCREIEIPERFIESDIDTFTKNKRFAAETKKRMAEIQQKLDFFGKEIFEDIETILRGDEYDETEKGFIKKFILKKNDKDVLMQYVEPSKRMSFSQHKLTDIFSLLYEYKACVNKLRDEDAESLTDASSDEESIKLALVAEKAMEIIDSIAQNADNVRRKRLSNVFRLICVIPVDSNLARKMTLARASLNEAFYGNESGLKRMSDIMGVDFASLSFESGILSFDGLSKHLSDMCEKLECTTLWTKWLARAEKTSKILPEFVKHLEKHGALENVDRLFAKSLLYKACEKIKKDVSEGLSYENLGRAKESYPDLLSKAATVSKSNILANYINAVSHLNQVNAGKTVEGYASIGFRELMEKEFKTVTKLLPVIVVSKNDLTSLLPLDCVFDNVICLDNRDNGYSMLPALGFGKRACVINMSRSALSKMGNALSGKVQTIDVCTYVKDKDPYNFTWLNSTVFGESRSVSSPFEKTGIELVRMNGIFHRTTGRINKTEAEQSLIKSAELCVDKTKSVAITAFTKEQCSIIEKMLHQVKKKNKILREAVEENRICVCTPDRLYMKDYNCLVVSACFGQDREGRIGWDFGYAGKAWNEEVPEAYISISDKVTEKTYFLTSLNEKDSRLIRRTGINAEIFNSFCEMLSDGRVPVCMKQTDAFDEQSLISSVMSCVVKKNPRVVPCRGKLPVKNAMSSVMCSGDLFVIADGEDSISMHDELLLKKSLENTGVSVTTLSPFSLAGEAVKETLREFAKEEKAERISG